MQQCDDHRLHVQPGLRHHLRDPHRVKDIGFAGFAALMAVMVLGVGERLVEQMTIGGGFGREVLADGVLEPFQANLFALRRDRGCIGIRGRYGGCPFCCGV